VSFYREEGGERASSYRMHTVVVVVRQDRPVLLQVSLHSKLLQC
jgi:hypothetical protein